MYTSEYVSKLGDWNHLETTINPNQSHKSPPQISQHLPPTSRPPPPGSHRINTPVHRTSSPQTRSASRCRSFKHFNAVSERDCDRLRVESGAWAGLRDVQRLVCVAGGRDVEGLKLAGEGEAVCFPFVRGRVDEVLGAGAAAVAELGRGKRRGRRWRGAFADADDGVGGETVPGAGTGDIVSGLAAVVDCVAV